MFSAALSSGHAGGSDTMVRFFGTLSLRVVCQPAWSRMTMACAPGATAWLISSHRDTSVAAWANCAEQIGVLVTLIFCLPWSRALLGPLVDERVLLSDPHFILEPHLDRGCQCKSAHGLQHTGWKTFFLKVAIASRSCLGCSGRALMCEKPSFLRTRPRLTSDRSTPKRSPRTRLRSTQRQRATPSFSGSGPASTRRRNSSICSFESFGGRPGDLALIRPSAPSSLKRCTQSRSV